MPVIDGGQFAAKAVVGLDVTVTSKAFADGHDKLAVHILWRALKDEPWNSAVMNELGNNGWQGQFNVPEQAFYVFRLEDWIDQLPRFRYELEYKFAEIGRAQV